MPGQRKRKRKHDGNNDNTPNSKSSRRSADQPPLDVPGDLVPDSPYYSLFQCTPSPSMITLLSKVGVYNPGQSSRKANREGNNSSCLNRNRIKRIDKGMFKSEKLIDCTKDISAFDFIASCCLYYGFERCTDVDCSEFRKISEVVAPRCGSWPALRDFVVNIVACMYQYPLNPGKCSLVSLFPVETGVEFHGNSIIVLV